ncbi:MAG: YbaK/EbsC family protein [Deltaproteobacteria bacterium]|nr:YbaK/EbsC family protein [Deltaproteobacteria bacterium]
MSIPRRLEVLLKERHVDFKALIHPEAYTAQEVAASMHVKGQELAKAVMVKTDGSFVMTVLPASGRIDFQKLKEFLGKKDVRHNIDTVVDSALTQDEEIFFNAGSHYEAVEMRYRDYEELVKPKIADFSRH